MSKGKARKLGLTKNGFSLSFTRLLIPMPVIEALVLFVFQDKKQMNLAAFKSNK